MREHRELAARTISRAVTSPSASTSSDAFNSFARLFMQRPILVRKRESADMKPKQDDRRAEVLHTELRVGHGERRLGAQPERVVGPRRVGKADVRARLDFLRYDPAQCLQQLTAHGHRVGLRVDDLLERHHWRAAT
eukprot:4175570-Prymnesium_polylepis.2